jgi:hypothetical protein
MSTIVDVDTFLDFLAEVFVEQPRMVEPPREEYMELAKFEDTNLAPMLYEAERRNDRGYGSEFVTLSAFKSLNSVNESIDSRSSRVSSIPRKVTSTPNFAPMHPYPKRPVYEQRPPPISSSTFHNSSLDRGSKDFSRALTPVGATRYSSDVLPTGERPWVYQKPLQTAIRDEKRSSPTKFWKRRKSFSTMTGA